MNMRFEARPRGDYDHTGTLKRWGVWDSEADEWARTAAGYVFITLDPGIAHEAAERRNNRIRSI